MAQRGRQIAEDDSVVTLSRNASMSLAAGLLLLASALYLEATDNLGSTLRAVFAHAIWATTFAGQTLQRRNP